MIKLPATRMLSSPILSILGPSLKHWCTSLIEMSLIVTCIILAWIFQTVISAFYASVRGGKLFAQGLFGIIVEQARMGVIICPGIIGTDFDPNDSVLDEIVGFLIAAQGFFFQLTQGFILPFPFNLVLLPLSIVEWLIRSQMSPDMKDWADVSRQLEDVVDVSSFVS